MNLFNLYIVTIPVILTLISCTSLPSVESGKARIQVHYLYSGYSNKYEMKILSIRDIKTKDIVFEFKDKSFGAMEAIIPEGIYDITYQCFGNKSETTYVYKKTVRDQYGMPHTRYIESRLKSIEYTDRYTIHSGDDLKLRRASTMKTMCRPKLFVTKS